MAASYDEFVNWDARLEREAPFFRRLFEERDVHSVADVGAGSARHAIMFRSWGIDVTAIDPDERMIEAAVANAERLSSDVRIARSSFGEVAETLGVEIDAITCTGNALPHVAGVAGLREAIADFAATLRRGGLLVLHYLNHDRLLGMGLRSMPPVFRQTEEGDLYFLRVLDYTPDRDGILFDFVTLTRDPAVREGTYTRESWAETTATDPLGGWSIECRRSVHTALPLDLVSAELMAAGFGDIRAFGDHTGRALDQDADESVIVVATRL